MLRRLGGWGEGRFSNLRLNGKSLEVERTPLVAVIAEKVEQEKELIKTFEPTKNDLLPLVEARFNAIGPIWLGSMFRNITCDSHSTKAGVFIWCEHPWP